MGISTHGDLNGIARDVLGANMMFARKKNIFCSPFFHFLHLLQIKNYHLWGVGLLGLVIVMPSLSSATKKIEKRPPRVLRRRTLDLLDERTGLDLLLKNGQEIGHGGRQKSVVGDLWGYSNRLLRVWEHLQCMVARA